MTVLPSRWRRLGLRTALLAVVSFAVVHPQPYPVDTLRAVAAIDGQEIDSVPGLYEPSAVEVGVGDELFICDRGNDRFVVYGDDGKFLRQFGGYGTQPGRFNRPEDLEVHASGNLYIIDSYNSRIQILDRNGSPIRQIPVTGYPDIIALGPDGRIYTKSDYAIGAKLFSVFATDGTALGMWGDLTPSTAGDSLAAIALNRCRMAFGPGGRRYLVRDPFAVVERYGADGRREAVYRISGPEVDFARKVFYNNWGTQFARASLSLSDTAVTTLMKEVEVASKAARVPRSMEYIAEARAWKDELVLLVTGGIYILDADGRVLCRLVLVGADGNPVYVHRMALNSRGELYGLDAFHTFTCYRFGSIQ
jgi:DNA-binding beta-propeller fold protein YncE